MKPLSKILSVFINLANYGVGIAVALILILKKDFISVFYIHGMTSNESLFFNMILFQAGLAAVGVVLCLLVNEYQKSDKPVTFPVIYEIVPVFIAAISIYFAFAGETVREKIVVIACAVLYAVLSPVIIYCGARIFNQCE